MCCNIAGEPPFCWHSSCPLPPPHTHTFFFPLCLFKPLSVISSDNVARRPMPLPRCLSAQHGFYQCVFSSSRFWCIGKHLLLCRAIFFFQSSSLSSEPSCRQGWSSMHSLQDAKSSNKPIPCLNLPLHSLFNMLVCKICVTHRSSLACGCFY